MRDTFIEGIYRKMAERSDIFFLSADFGAPALDKLRKDFGGRFVNVGIAEQNLINVATGLGLEGYTVYAYAIAPFLTMRAYEQIRINLSISTHIRPLNINLVGVGGGVSYDVAGPTHHCLEDMSIMRLLPNMAVFSPSDWTLAEQFIDYSLERKIPKYLRFDGKPTPSVYGSVPSIDFTKGFHALRNGSGTCIVATGFPVHTALAVAERLPGIGVIDIFMLKPLDEAALADALRQYSRVITIEEGFLNNGGLDALVAKAIRRNGSCAALQNLGFDDKYVFDLGGRDYLYRTNGMDEEGIVSLLQRAA